MKKNPILDYEQANEIMNVYTQQEGFLEENDLGTTKYNLPIRHFIIGNGNNDIVISRRYTWK